MEKTNNIPVIVWLRVTDYMQTWLQRELGGDTMVGEQRVVSLQHLQGFKDTLKMETAKDTKLCQPVVNSMSAMLRNCINTGLEIDPDTILKEYGITRQAMEMFVPVEAPKLCMTKDGVLRPWGLDVAMGRDQSAAVQRLIRREFWQAVENFNKQYSKQHRSKSYPAAEMIEAFCAETNTPDTYVDAMRREWQRRVKRDHVKTQTAQSNKKQTKSVPITKLI